MLRQSRSPRHACGSFPTASRSGHGPLRAYRPWNACRLYRAVRRAVHCPAVRHPLPLPGAPTKVCARIPRQPAHTAALPKPCAPAAAPAYKGHTPTGRARPRHAVVLPFPSTTPPLVLLAAVQCPLVVPHGSPTSPAPPHPSPKPEHRRTEPHRGQAAWAPPAGLAQAISHPSAATNRSLVSPSTFSTHPPAETPTGVAQFRRAAPTGPPGDHIAKLEFFSRASLQLVTQIVKVLWLYLVNCVENHRKIGKIQNQFCWIRYELSYNSRYSCLS
jgi:hypothetical protein